jgi:hypothetical protein
MIAQEMFIEIDHNAIGFQGTLFGEIGFIAAPQVGQVRPGKDQFSRFESFDAVADKARAGAFQHHKQLVFRMCMPYRVEVFFRQAAYHEDMGERYLRLMQSGFQSIVFVVVSLKYKEIRIKYSQYWI